MTNVRRINIHPYKLPVVLVCCLISLNVRSAIAQSAKSNVFEPTVTREESAWIRDAVGISETNAMAAADWLLSKRGRGSSAALDYAAGNFLFQAGEEARAIDAYRQALEKMPAFRSARVNLARLYLLRDQSTDAVALLREVVMDGQGSADVYLLLGHALLLTDAIISAETAYRNCLMLRPGDSDALLGLARSLLPQDRPAETLALSRELVRREPERREFRALQANALLAMNREEDTAAVLESARRLGLADSDMLALLADLHLNAGRIIEACELYEKVVASDKPSWPRMLRAFESMTLAGHTDAAVRLRNVMEKEAGKNRNGMSQGEMRTFFRVQGDLARLLGDSEGAMKHYQSLLREDPLDGRTMLRVAELLQARDSFEDAAILLERAARVPEVQVEALVRHAQVEVQRERFGRAVELLEAAQTLEPRDHVGRYLEQVKRLEQISVTPKM
ncbi:MAG TPA: tetratricopeptide repeat protein [Kiritimatiellia bacterium]|nr:tetratricopeptide repeat protein [Kiritimatiellia bacterium]